MWARIQTSHSQTKSRREKKEMKFSDANYNINTFLYEGRNTLSLVIYEIVVNSLFLNK